MARVKTFTNGGSLLPSDLNSIQDDYEFAFSTYKAIIEKGSSGPGSTAAGGVYALGGTGALVPLANTTPAFYLDPADFLANTRVSKLRMKGTLVTNAVAPTINYTFGLYPVATWGGGSNVTPFVATLGAVIAGSSPAAINTPGANSTTIVTGADFSFPAVGWYVLGLLTSNAQPANCIVQATGQLQLRQV